MVCLCGRKSTSCICTEEMGNVARSVKQFWVVIKMRKAFHSVHLTEPWRQTVGYAKNDAHFFVIYLFWLLLVISLTDIVPVLIIFEREQLKCQCDIAITVSGWTSPLYICLYQEDFPLPLKQFLSTTLNTVCQSDCDTIAKNNKR